MNIVFNLRKLETKLAVSALILSIFIILYKTVPSDELNINDNFIDLLFYSVTTQIGVNTNQILIPKSSRAKILTLLHFIVGFCVYLL